MYGLLVAFAVVSALIIAEKRSAQYKIDKNIFWQLAFWCLVAGLIGARIYHVIDFWPYYRQNPQFIFAIWKGGLSILGGILAGILALFIMTKEKDRLFWLDLGASVLPLAQLIGRFGNYFNQEIYGRPTSLPWGICIDKENRPLGYVNYTKFHPLFLYEAILSFILFMILTKVYKTKITGLTFYTYLLGYGCIRLLMEFFRGNIWEMNAQYLGEIISMSLILFGLINILKLIHAQNNSGIRPQRIHTQKPDHKNTK